ncbi:uncharacterized protein LOC100204569 isoform X2 [Hydra vulgaris]|uniref:Uncharacterized protein LOC100204569 isoform X2 n=1 Tax=Hydra vulgaris TaxID=6087 RepID=A0ABM4BGV8_HYDVU
MELEELMSNRALLEKMTEANMHTNNFKIPPKNQVVTQNSIKPKEMCISYKKSNVFTVATKEPKCEELEVEKGNGCKLPTKLKRLFQIVWILILLCYMFGMPVILYGIYKKLVETKIKITVLENNLGASFKNKHINDVLKNKQIKDALKDPKQDEQEKEDLSNSYFVNNIEKDYNYPSGMEKRLILLTSNIGKTMEVYMQRINYLESIKTWFNDAKFNSFPNQKEECTCHVLSGIPKKSNAESNPGPPFATECDCQYMNQVSNGGQKFSETVLNQLPSESNINKFQVGEKGERGIKGETGPSGKPGINGTCLNCAFTKYHITYTHWGKSSCRIDRSTIYSGYIGSPANMDEGGGSNYLCMPELPKYYKNDTVSSKNSPIFGVEFELEKSNIMDLKYKEKHFNALCSICDVNERTNYLMIPAAFECPPSWHKEYTGFLMAQKKSLMRTQYICVDQEADFIKTVEDSGKGGYLHHVRFSSKMVWEINCVVCTN